MSVITKVTTYDFRFPTSATFSGSDAMNPDPDYSSAYVVVSTDAGDSGNGFVFTIGRGNDVVVRAIDSMSETLIGRNVEELLDNMRLAWDLFVRDSQLRWLGPEKGVEHMAIGAVLSALWDLKAKRAGKPLWLLLSEMEPEELVATLDFRYLTDALTPQEAIDILRAAQEGKAERIAHLKEVGYPGYSTAAGWLGYSDEKMVRLAKQETEVMGFKQIKLKVGQNLEDDLRRLKLAREAVGPDIAIAVDANQVWDVPQAIEWIGKFKDYDLAWVEEPTCPDDVLGHAAIQKAIDPIPANRCRTESCTSSTCRPAASRSCRSTPPESPVPRRSSSNTCSPRSSASRSALTRAASACAKPSASSRCSTMCPSPARWRTASSNTWTTSMNTSCIRPSSRTDDTSLRSLRATARR